MKPPRPKLIPSPCEKTKKGTPAAPFDLWLQRALHQMYDEATNEPIPVGLLELIEDDRTK